MLDIPAQLKSGYTRLLQQRDIPQHSHNAYLKWLRFYLDFCHKYSHTASAPSSLTRFILKLKQKNQTEQQIAQAQQAVVFFYTLIESHKSDSLSGFGFNSESGRVGKAFVR